MTGTFLEIKNGESAHRVPFAKDKFSIGRGGTNDIVLADDMASRAHAVIERVSGNFYLRDLGSRNGTKLNGERVSAVSELSDGDVIEIGRHQISLFVNDAPEVETVDELTADDLVIEDDTEQADDDVLPAEFFADDESVEVQLQKLAANLPHKGFEADQIELTDSRGMSLHSDGRKSYAQGEAIPLLKQLLLVCFRSRATDIHVEPRQDGHYIRLRIDGQMVDVAAVASKTGVRLATVVKVLCQIDIGQRSAIQEGAFAAKMPDVKHANKTHRVDYRVSFAPAVLGQKLVVRILDASGAPTRLSDLGLPRQMMETVARVIHQDSGMVLVCGPTGSGKTTTLYSLLRSIDLAKRNVVTIEDPVEVHLDGITQIPVDDEHDRSFLQLLRSVLRQDPDVILVGEIRDAETARVAMQAAITGHMVFSTVHTRDTIGTIFRLRDLGVEPYMLGQGLQLVIAQRLVRQLCPFCKQGVTPTPKQLAALGQKNAHVTQIFKPVGCPRCLKTGHAGRRAYFELLASNEELAQAIFANATRQELLKVIHNNPNFMTLRQSAIQLVADGFVALEEVEQDMGAADVS
jgi:type II secretory ATPase GspE/PulE/Tfp pilus assembly ATPase PilB-like protein